MFACFVGTRCRETCVLWVAFIGNLIYRVDGIKFIESFDEPRCRRRRVKLFIQNLEQDTLAPPQEL